MKKLSALLLLSVLIFAASCSSKSSTTTTSWQTSKTECNEKYLNPNTTHEVVFTTSKGSFTVTLDVKNAPISSAHLAALVQSGFYNGLTFHRVVKDFVIQGGDPKGDGSGSSKCSVQVELPKNGYKQGDFAWAKTSAAPPGDAGSQFFIVTAAAGSQGLAALDQQNQATSEQASSYQYGYGGTVTSGFDVVKAIEALAPTDNGGDGPPTEKVTIIKAELKS